MPQIETWSPPAPARSRRKRSPGRPSSRRGDSRCASAIPVSSSSHLPRGFVFRDVRRASDRVASRPAPRGLSCPHPPTWARRLSVLACLALALWVRAAEVIPPAPPNHFNDFAKVVRPETAAQLNRELAQFERDTSTQIVVAVHPRMQSDSSVEDYTVRVAQQWGVGRREQSNGAVLFVFQESREVRIVTGYGLEGALPDALAKQIIENEIVPRFRAGDFDAGLAAGVRAMMGAVRGEYRGTGRTTGEAGARGGALPRGAVMLLVILAMAIMGAIRARTQRHLVYGRRGRRTLWGGGPWMGGGRMGGGGGFRGGGTFSGGGGSFGGGGAGGRW